MNRFEEALLRYIKSSDLKKIQNTLIGVAGAGGLGSNCLHALVRSGFKKFVIADFDKVDFSNLNRQFFFTDQEGMLKTEAVRENLLRINPDLELSLHSVLVTKENVNELFAECDITVEAFDRIECKKMILEELKGPRLISASGLGCMGDTDGIRTRKISNSLTIIGDFTNCVSEGVSPLSPGVTVAAAKQAGAVLNCVLKEVV